VFASGIARSSEALLRHLRDIDNHKQGRRAHDKRKRAIGKVLETFRARAMSDDARQRPAHQVEGVQRGGRASRLRTASAARTDHAQHFFEDTALKQRALDVVLAA
jgi:hypothetical protein